MRVCWNRQTGTFEGRVSKDVWVQVPLLAPISSPLGEEIFLLNIINGVFNMKRFNKIHSILKKGTAYPPVSIEYIENIEKQLNITFPDDFKIFYTQISNGAYVSRHHRLYSIEKILNKLEEKQLNKKFSFNNSYVWGYELSMTLHPEVDFGNIEIADMGCGMTWCLIVNSNLSYGTMWFFSEVGILKSTNNSNFFEWFELWSQGKDDELTKAPDKKDSYFFADTLKIPFPEKSGNLLKHYEYYGGLLAHIFFADEISVPLFELLKQNTNIAEIKKYCSFVEDMWLNGTDDVVNVVDVTILERLSDDSTVWKNFGRYISNDFIRYINTDLLLHNSMMYGAERLNYNR